MKNNMSNALPENHGGLYAPQVGPTLRKLTDARHARIKKFFPHTVPAPKSELQVVVRNNSAALRIVEAPGSLLGGRDWLIVASAALDDQRFVISIRRIQKTVAAFYNVGLLDLRSHRRTQPVTFYRQIAMYLCKELTTNSLPAIGRQFGGRDHTTVLHAWRKIAPMRADPDFDTQMRGLISLIMAAPPEPEQAASDATCETTSEAR
jgi:hypothetical protein